MYAPPSSMLLETEQRRRNWLSLEEAHEIHLAKKAASAKCSAYLRHAWPWDSAGQAACERLVRGAWGSSGRRRLGGA
jgi:hypothetical protein